MEIIVDNKLNEMVKPQALPIIKRIQKSATIVLNDTIANVFPLFGPVREMDWADGWSPEILFGTQQVELHMIFKTEPRFDTEEAYTWIVTTFDPDHHEIEYTVSAHHRVWFIHVKCSSIGHKTSATIRYTYTGFNENACMRNEVTLNEMFSTNLEDWQEAINHYLRTGSKLKN